MAIRCGIPYSDFLKMTPRILGVYRDEYERKAQENADMIDYTAWLHGLYVMKAVGSCLNEKNKYPSERLGLGERDIEEDSSMAAVRFADWADAANKAWKEKGR